MLRTYTVLAGIVEPLVVALVRMRAGGAERIARVPVARPKGRLAWLHGESVGESMLLLPLIEAMRDKDPELSFLVTSRTASSAKILKDRLPTDVTYTYAPLDLPGCVDRFLGTWKPDLLVLSESALWPVKLALSHRAGIPIALVNARLSQGSMRNWRRFGNAAKELLSLISVVFASDQKTVDDLIALGAPAHAVHRSASLKARVPLLPADPKQLAEIQHSIGQRQRWLAASVHREDAEVVLRAHAKVRAQMPEALLILVPAICACRHA